ncbi:MAG: hypothetical protein ACK4N5_24460, partial [Myxococcales bacterium]
RHPQEAERKTSFLWHRPGLPHARRPGCGEWKKKGKIRSSRTAGRMQRKETERKTSFLRSRPRLRRMEKERKKSFRPHTGAQAGRM